MFDNTSSISMERYLKMSLQLKNVSKQFGSFSAVRELHLEIEDETLFGFLGGNGAGKTTTFRMILGLLDVSEGEIFWRDEKIDYNNSHLIGYLPEERGLYPKLEVLEQLIYLGRLRGMQKKNIVTEVKYWLDRLQVPHYIDKKVEELSKGNQQKIQFISAVLHQPKLLILDEPFSGLDPVNVEILKEAVLELRDRGTTIVFSSHQMDLVEELCENLCILHKGEMVVQGSLREVKRSFAKKNLRIHADFPLQFLESHPGVVHYRSIAEGCEFQIRDADVSQEILAELQGKGFIRTFDLQEPTLHEIFIEKVGEPVE